MAYTLWSHGELLGESALDYVRVDPNLRTGDLQMTERGLIVIDRLTQVREDCYRSARRVNSAPAGTVEEVELKTLYADLAAQHDQYEALALELHAPNGSLIPTDDINVTDTHYLLKIDREREDEDKNLPEGALDTDLDPDVLAALEEQMQELAEDNPPWVSREPEREPARYQISVVLKDEWSIP
jgi:hypothetical protein